MRGKNSPFERRPFLRWIVLALLFAAVIIGCSTWSHLLRVERVCEQLVTEKRLAVVSRKKAEERAIAERERAARKAQRQRLDLEAREAQIKWSQTIGKVTVAMQDEGAGSGSQGSRASLPPVTFGADDRERELWAAKRLAPKPPPQVSDAGWCRNPIDRFIYAKLEAAGLAPNPPASHQVLVRRLWFDLIGLPPQPEELAAALASPSPERNLRSIDQLLGRPEFGERWGRMWLDLARYADSNGYEEDELRPNAYPYRDFVIWAMNIDLPFDRFIRWQIAGDELAPENPMAVAATGFFTAAPLNTFMPQEPERSDELDNMVSTMGTAMLGVTVGCARCHDHMYDPIPTEEYYRLVAIFSGTRRTQSYLVPDGGKAYRKWFDPVDKRRQEIKQIRKARRKEDNIRALDHFTEEEKNLLRQPLDPTNLEQDRLISLCERCLLITDDQLGSDLEPLPQDQQRYDQLQAELHRLEAALPTQPPLGLALSGSAESMTHVLEGGQLNRKGEKVGPGFLAALTAGDPHWNDGDWKQWAAVNSGKARPRTALAYWMTDVDRGAGALVARVIVNRLWQHHFGAGLVRTSSDFGSQGELPTHPELLDWLASELIDHNWSLKHIHRLIVTSATYRQSSERSAEQARQDPENRLCGRYPRQRITAEMMRDSLLCATGNLNREMYGPGVQPPIPRDAVFNTQDDVEDTWPCDEEADRPAVWRRSVYVMLKRTVPVPLLQLFDAPSSSFSCAERKETTVPTQALALWNSSFVLKQTERLSEKILVTSASPDEQVTQLYRLMLSRYPTSRERAACIQFLRREADQPPPISRKQRLAELCHVLLMSNEFFYID